MSSMTVPAIAQRFKKLASKTEVTKELENTIVEWKHNYVNLNVFD